MVTAHFPNSPTTSQLDPIQTESATFSILILIDKPNKQSSIETSPAALPPCSPHSIASTVIHHRLPSQLFSPSTGRTPSLRLSDGKMDSQRPNDASPEAMQSRIQQARREAETLKDRIKRKKDELADTTRKILPLLALPFNCHCHHVCGNWLPVCPLVPFADMTCTLQSASFPSKHTRRSPRTN